jgi:hypothetical protein
MENSRRRPHPECVNSRPDFVERVAGDYGTSSVIGTRQRPLTSRPTSSSPTGVEKTSAENRGPVAAGFFRFGNGKIVGDVLQPFRRRASAATRCTADQARAGRQAPRLWRRSLRPRQLAAGDRHRLSGARRRPLGRRAGCRAMRHKGSIGQGMQAIDSSAFGVVALPDPCVKSESRDAIADHDNPDHEQNHNHDRDIVHHQPLP